MRQEDFLTDVLCGVLGKRQSLAAGFANWLMPEDQQLLQDSTSITAQTRVEGDQPDMRIDAEDTSGRRHVLIVENKLGAPEGHRQLERYRAMLDREQAATKTLAYITHASASPPEDPRVVHRTWFQVYGWLKDWIAAREEDALVGEVVELMEDWNMDVTVTTRELAAATVWKKSTQNSLNELLALVQAQVRQRVRLGGGSRWVPSESPRYLSRQSPGLRDLEGVRLEYGFDFERDDEDWSVDVMQIPSAYFTISDRSEEALSCPDGWAKAGWVGYTWVKHIRGPVSFTRPWTDFYLSFFAEALDDLVKILDGKDGGGQPDATHEQTGADE
ncbi:MAG: hypothetical protein OXH68_15960 [Gammaproteobacteria bacterium]|nr:hypothetical protein [Gammaproteobacteria bacterium]